MAHLILILAVFAGFVLLKAAGEDSDAASLPGGDVQARPDRELPRDREAQGRDQAGDPAAAHAPGEPDPAEVATRSDDLPGEAPGS